MEERTSSFLFASTSGGPMAMGANVPRGASSFPPQGGLHRYPPVYDSGRLNMGGNAGLTLMESTGATAGAHGSTLMEEDDISSEDIASRVSPAARSTLPTKILPLESEHFPPSRPCFSSLVLRSAVGQAR